MHELYNCNLFTLSVACTNYLRNICFRLAVAQDFSRVEFTEKIFICILVFERTYKYMFLHVPNFILLVLYYVTVAQPIKNTLWLDFLAELISNIFDTK